MTKCAVGSCSTQTRVSAILCDEHAVQVWREVEVASLPTKDRATRQPVAPAQEWVYYLRLDEKIKIGWTSNFMQRMSAYPPHAVVIVKHPGTRADERDLHRSFKPSRAAGREWYHPTPELLAHIERVKEDNARKSREEQAAREAAAPPMPGPIGRVRPRSLRGGTLVRAIIAGEVD